MKRCEACGGEFKPHRNTQRYCSNLCSARHAPRRRNPKRGEEHYAWKGAAARDETKRLRAQALFPLDGVVCEYDGCDEPATDRHHISGDTNNNRRENLWFLCRRHHMVEDGRLGALVSRNKSGRKLTDDQVDAIRADPRSQRLVADEYGISPSYVGQLKAGIYRSGARAA